MRLSAGDLPVVRSAFTLVVLALMVAVVLLAIFPEDDLVVSGWFWRQGSAFWLAEHGWARLLRQVSMWPTIALAVAALVALAQHVVWPARRPLMGARAALFLLVTVLAAPVLLVNGVLKEHWERARPVHVTEFGGTWRFTPWWRPGDGSECRTNCSFVSGEASGAAWLAAPALVAPPALRPAALAAAAVYTAAISALRIAFGGHFLSDTLLAILLTLAVVALAYHWLFRRRGAPDEAALAARLARIGAPVRALLARLRALL